MNNIPRPILSAAGVVAVAALLWLALKPSAVEVDVAVASEDTLSVTIAVEGRTRARDRYSVTAPITGRLERLEVLEGRVVSAGDLLGVVRAAPEDPRIVAVAQAQVRTAEAGLEQATSLEREAAVTAQQAAREVERRRALLEMGALSREVMEQVELMASASHERLEAAQAAVSAAEATLSGARSRLMGAEAGGASLHGVEIRAPVSGRVLRVPDSSERVVVAGTPLLELANTGALEVVLDVLSEEAVRILPGQRLVITTWGGDGPLTGVIRTPTLAGYTKVSALGVEEQRVDVIADLPEPPATLGTGYRVQGEIVVWSGPCRLVVPTSALFRSGGSWQVFRVVDGRAAAVDVVLGRRNDQSVEILDGLGEGDTVVLFPSGIVDEGVAVRTR